MVDVIIDTSSLLSFALVTGGYKGYGDDFQTPSILNSAIRNVPYRSVWIGFENTLEAMVLYDNLLIDGSSFERSKIRVPEIEVFEEFCELVKVSNSEEKKYYASIQAFYQTIKGNSYTTELTSLLEINRSLMEEVEDLDKCLSRSVWRWEDIEEYLPDYLREIANSLKAIMGEFTPESSAALINILRTFYYQALQLSLNTDLLLHPSKGHHYNDFYKTRIKTNIPSPASIVGMFDTKVRESYIKKQEDWLGEGITFRYPILTQYLLNKTDNSWKDLIRVCVDLRNSDKAKNFRREVNILRDAIESRDRITVNEVVASLEKQAEVWSRNLGAPIGLTREVAVSIPLIIVNPEIKLDVPDKKLGKKYPGEKILVFMHELLQYST
ncbi:MAG: hypothetical protein JO235_11445 [Chroococcidiopsidaceae cyanobacterium CP_BM_RX_35]|nr:hypothetical protein [Chroococcidiopsidaceae cyanobacterium CP_BM_RX_35]